MRGGLFWGAAMKITTLGSLAHGRDNNFNLLRMLAATAVLVSHSFPLTLGSSAAEPLKTSLQFTLGTVAVQVFFVVSGFFIAKSFDRRSSSIDFAVARILRLYPALLVALGLTVAWGVVVTTLSASSYFGARDTWTYIPINASLRKLQEDLPGVFVSNPIGGATNGSLWTLYSEVKCYALVALIGLVRLLRPNRFIFPAIAMMAYQIHGRMHDPFADKALFVALSWPFFVGMVGYVYREKIPHSAGVAAMLFVFVVISNHFTTIYAILFPIAVGYAALWLGLAHISIIRQYNRLGDYSYGMYIYAWPIQQTLVQFFSISLPSILIIAAFPIALFIAILSWTFIEGPILKYRHRIGQAVSHRLPLI